MNTLGDQLNDIMQDAIKDVVSLADEREEELLQKIAELEKEIEELNEKSDE